MRGGIAALAFCMLPSVLAFAQTENRLPEVSTATSDVTRVVGPPRGQPVTGALLDAKTYQVGSLLRCPVCQGLSVSDSPSGMAQNMKSQVRELLAAGFDQEQILSYFERSYGEFVHLRPPLRGVNWLVWLGPVLALGVGALIVRRVLRALRGVPAPVSAEAALPTRGALPEDPRLAAYVLKVREMAYGWPGGVPPQKSEE